ncbi:MAG: hypothetical protein VZR56_12660 [Treponema sp.]|nr:hypothetical protein [Treponema sp.]
MSVLSVFCNVVIPLLALLAAILSLIIDYLGYKKESESEKDRREKNPDRHVDAEEHHFLEARGEPPDDWEDVIPLLVLLVEVLPLILDELEREEESEKDQREKNPDRYVDAEEHHFLEARGEPLDDRKNDESKGAKKEQETNTQA